MRWTLPKPFERQVRWHINTSTGISPYCRFDVVVSLDPEIEGMDIELAPDADDDTVKWFPHLHKGMLRGLENGREEGRTLVGIRVVIKQIDTHPVGTTEHACELNGCLFAYADLVSKAVRLSP